MTDTIRATLSEGWVNKYSLLDSLERDLVSLTIAGERIAPSSLPLGSRVLIFDSFGSSILVARNTTSTRGRRGMWHTVIPNTQRTI